VSIGAEQSPQKLECIPLYNDTVQQRIEEMAMNVEQQVTKLFKKSRYFAIQLDRRLA